MALLNGLLDALLANHEESLLLSPGRVPRFRTNDRETAAAAFELDGGIIGDLLAEVVPDVQVLEPVPGGRCEFVYESHGVAFDFRAVSTPEGWAVEASPAAEEPLAADRPASRPREEASPVQRDPSGDAPPADPPPSVLDATSQAQPGPRPVPPQPTEKQEPAGRAIAPVLACSDSAPSEGELPAIGKLLRAMLERDASDLHLSADQLPRLRLNGSLCAVGEWGAPSSTQLTSVLERIMPPRNLKEFEETNDTDFAYEITGVGRFRVNVFRERHGIGGVFRYIPITLPSFEELGLPEVLRKLTSLNKGLVLVTGPTGSGKSTTLAAMINLINRSRQDHIITIEDPIEFVHESDQCLVTQREVGPHTGSFDHALRAALREDPDIVLVGEMRDLETMSTAIHTAETGHLVFGTLHTTSAPGTVERLIGQFPGELQGQIRLMLADSLRAVVSQTLLRKVGGGRVAAFEVLLGTPAVGNLIREGKTFQIASTMQTGRNIGMSTMTDALFDLVNKGVVEPAEAFSKAVFKEALAGKFDAAGIRLEAAKEAEESEQVA